MPGLPTLPRVDSPRLATALTAALAALALVAAAFALRFTPAAPASSADPAAGAVTSTTSTPSETTKPALTINVNGDSILHGASVDVDRLALGDLTWLKYLDPTRIELVGGFAKPGETTKNILQDAIHHEADLQVVMLGTNDRRTGISASAAARNLARLATTLKVKDPKTFVIIAPGPSDNEDAEKVIAYTKAMKAQVIRNGWSWVDPWPALTSDGARYSSPELTIDGLHPSSAGAEVLARELTPLLEPIAGK